MATNICNICERRKGLYLRGRICSLREPIEMTAPSGHKWMCPNPYFKDARCYKFKEVKSNG